MNTDEIVDDCFNIAEVTILSDASLKELLKKRLRGEPDPMERQ